MRKEEIQDERNRLKSEYGDFFDTVSEILFRHDPIGINFESNTDEYEPEVGTILPRLKSCHSAEDLTTVIHEEFRRWFSYDLAGPRDKYREIAVEIWHLWHNV